MGEHGLAGDVAHGIDPGVGSPTALVDDDEAALVEGHTRGLQPEPSAARPSSDRHEHSIEGLGASPFHADLDPRGLFPQRRDSGLQANRVEELLRAPRQRLDEIAVDPWQQPIGHLHQGDATAQGGVHLAQFEADVAAADHEQTLGHVGEIERGRGIHHAVALDGDAGKPARRLVEDQQLPDRRQCVVGEGQDPQHGATDPRG